MAKHASKRLPMPRRLRARTVFLRDGSHAERVRDNSRAPRYKRGEYVLFDERGRECGRCDEDIIESLPEVRAQLKLAGEEPGIGLRELTAADLQRKAELYREMQIDIDNAFQAIDRKYYSRMRRLWPDHLHLLLQDFSEAFDLAWKRPQLLWGHRDDMDKDGRYLPLEQPQPKQ